MLAVLYLVLASLIGAELCAAMLPSLDGSRMAAQRRPVAQWVIGVPAAFLVGTLSMTWATYLVAWSLRDSSHGMAGANAIVMGAGLAGLTLWVVRARRRSKVVQLWRSLRREHAITENVSAISSEWPWLDVAVAVIGLGVGTALMLHTARIEGTTLVLGRTAFGDLNIHLGMARSFSRGNNFPTGYVAYAGTDIRYHFMFYFLVGNLEFLGLPLDWALNLPCILSFVSVLMLLYALGAVIGRDRRVGAVAILFFLLRSSPAAFFYFARLKAPGFAARVSELVGTNRFIGMTAHESWGIWNLNVYVVERHFGFAFGLVLIAVLYLVRTTGLDTGSSPLKRISDSTRTPASAPD
ncbi:MAG: hypothetical protein ABJB49_10520 [Nitrospirota bacterium]